MNLANFNTLQEMEYIYLQNSSMQREILGADGRPADAVVKHHIPSLRISLKYAE